MSSLYENVCTFWKGEFAVTSHIVTSPSVTNSFITVSPSQRNTTISTSAATAFFKSNWFYTKIKRLIFIKITQIIAFFRLGKCLRFDHLYIGVIVSRYNLDIFELLDISEIFHNELIMLVAASMYHIWDVQLEHCSWFRSTFMHFIVLLQSR